MCRLSLEPDNFVSEPAVERICVARSYWGEEQRVAFDKLRLSGCLNKYQSPLMLSLSRHARYACQ